MLRRVNFASGGSRQTRLRYSVANAALCQCQNVKIVKHHAAPYRGPLSAIIRDNRISLNRMNCMNKAESVYFPAKRRKMITRWMHRRLRRQSRTASGQGWFQGMGRRCHGHKFCRGEVQWIQGRMSPWSRNIRERNNRPRHPGCQVERNFGCRMMLLANSGSMIIHLGARQGGGLKKLQDKVAPMSNRRRCIRVTINRLSN